MGHHDRFAVYPAKLAVRGAAEPFPEGRRLPRGWTAVSLDGSDGILLEWNAREPADERTIAEGSRLRIAIALDCRSAREVEVFLAQSGERIGSFDIRYAYTFQPFELALDGRRTAAAIREGVVLRSNGEGQPLWIFDELQGDEARRLFNPHLLIGGAAGRIEPFLHSIASLSSLQPFGWLEGCVLDGLYALRPVIGAERVDPAIDKHLRQYLSEDGRLMYEDLHGQAADDKLTTIEATLPLAVIAKLYPGHPVVSRALAFWEARSKSGSGAIVDGDTITAEGAYTVAYPLAAIAAKLERADLAERAIGELLIRRNSLARDKHLYLRHNRKTDALVFRSWSRAYAWYMLGMTRTWRELQQSAFGHWSVLDELEREIRRMAEVAMHWARPDGLWSAFLDEPNTGAETSGSAGIAAALALGAGYGLLDRGHYDEAGKTFAALQSYLTPDGLLSGVTQHNAGGMELQTGGYRVLSQMGMGLTAQLYAALSEFGTA